MWHFNDTVAALVLDTVRDRTGDEAVYAWAESVGEKRFYELLNDHTGDVAAYFEALNEDPDGEEMLELEYTSYNGIIGPAIDRIENAFTSRV